VVLKADIDISEEHVSSIFRVKPTYFNPEEGMFFRKKFYPPTSLYGVTPQYKRSTGYSVQGNDHCLSHKSTQIHCKCKMRSLLMLKRGVKVKSKVLPVLN
jgi:hypothetical protein